MALIDTHTLDRTDGTRLVAMIISLLYIYTYTYTSITYLCTRLFIYLIPPSFAVYFLQSAFCPFFLAQSFTFAFLPVCLTLSIRRIS